VHIGLGENEEARAVLAGIAGTPGIGNVERLEAAEGFLRAGDCAEALRIAELLAPAVRDRDALPLRAECYVVTRDADGLARLLGVARALAPRNVPITVGVADALSRQGLHRETLDLLRTVTARSPGNFRARLLAARSEVVLKNPAAALTHLAAAEKLSPESPELLAVRALYESEIGNHARAAELLERALGRVPNDVLVLKQLVVAAMKANQSAKAVRAAESMLALEPDNPDFIYLLGAAALQNNSLQKAEAALTRYLGLRPTDSRGCLALGLAYAAQPERLDRALEQMRGCLALDPNNFEAAYQLGLAHKTQGESDRALAYFEQTVRLSPTHAFALKELGVAYLQSGDETRARRSLEAAVALIPNDADIHFQLSRLYNLIGQRELARKHLELFQKLKDRKSGGM
jgi:tetratricopeptide (TPR) repeat protein